MPVEIRIRPFCRQDQEPLYQAVRGSIEHLSVWLPWCSAAYSMDDSRDWIAYTESMWFEQREFHFVIEAVGSGELLGGVGITSTSRKYRLGKLGYWVRHSRVRRGIAAAATLQAARYGFEQLQLVRLEIEIAEGNRASCGVAEKIGAVYDGLYRDKLTLGGQPVAAHCYSLVPGDLVAGPEFKDSVSKDSVSKDKGT